MKLGFTSILMVTGFWRRLRIYAEVGPYSVSTIAWCFGVDNHGPVWEYIKPSGYPLSNSQFSQYYIDLLFLSYFQQYPISSL
jgi:hypothetical protein